MRSSREPRRSERGRGGPSKPANDDATEAAEGSLAAEVGRIDLDRLRRRAREDERATEARRPGVGLAGQAAGGEGSARSRWAARLVVLLETAATVVTDPTEAPSTRSPDPGDDYLVALAEAEQAALVTGDQHLLGLPGDLPIFSPVGFLEWLAKARLEAGYALLATDEERGQVWWVDVGLEENKRFVVVSNNVRNRALREVVMVRLTAADKPDIPSIVELGPGEISDTGCFAVADDVWMIGKEGTQWGVAPGHRPTRPSRFSSSYRRSETNSLSSVW